MANRTQGRASGEQLKDNTTITSKAGKVLKFKKIGKSSYPPGLNGIDVSSPFHTRLVSINIVAAHGVEL